MLEIFGGEYYEEYDMLIIMWLMNWNFFLRLYRILYTQIGQDPTISLIADDDLTNESFSYLDNGTKIINLSVDEFLALDNYNVFPNEIESKNDYLFSGNVKDYLKTNQDIYTKLK